MCYKEEKQKVIYDKFLEKSKDVPDFIKDYFSYLKSSNTIINNFGTINNFIEYLYSKKIISGGLDNITIEDLNKITSFNLIAYFDSLGIKNSSIMTKANVLSGFWKHLVEEDIVQKNIVTKKLKDKYKTEEEHVVKAPTGDEVFNLLMGISEIKNQNVSIKYTAIVKLLIGTGIRVDELIGIDINDLHFEEDVPFIVVMRKGKQKTKDLVEIPRFSIDAIKEYLKARDKQTYVKDYKALFISTRGTRLKYATIYKELKIYSEGKINPHKLRDYTATSMYENGADLMQISNQLGHKSMETARKHYIKNNSGANSKELEKITWG